MILAVPERPLSVKADVCRTSFGFPITSDQVAYHTIPSASSRDAHVVVCQRSEYIDPLMPFDGLCRDRITVARIAFGVLFGISCKLLIVKEN